VASRRSPCLWGGRSTALYGPSGVDRAVQSEAGKRARRVGACGCGSSARRSEENAAASLARAMRRRRTRHQGPTVQRNAREPSEGNGKRVFLIGGPDTEVAERSAYAGDVTGAPGPLASASGRADASRVWSGRARRFPGGPI
jgi:hypothetical protein